MDFAFIFMCSKSPKKPMSQFGSKTPKFVQKTPKAYKPDTKNKGAFPIYNRKSTFI